MAEVTANMVKELREKTDAPMMECKKALAEAAGNMDRAEEILRVKLGNKAAKASSRVAAEGMVAIHVDAPGKIGSIVEVNCETDFVAKNEEFQAFVRALAALVTARAPADVTALSALSLEGAGVEAARIALVGKIGEHISIRRFARLQAVGRLLSYVHGGSKIGVLVDLTGGDDALGKDLAMHIAASKPKSLRADGVPLQEVARERSIAEQKAAESGKPAEIQAKMVEGAVQKYLKEVTLLGQPFVKDDKLSVEQLLKRNGATVNAFALFVVGEGIDRPPEDFAAEVAAAARR
ncbi:MAG TPA: translation elongation factor Ts [Burkholderiaceae bacterium]|jgi:elongation factor Ts|nr:translation elongation factor Ts [Burkholderiaceae bacterium]